MNAFRHFTGLFQDSPTSGLDRAKLISGFTIGTTGLLLNAAVFLFVLPLMVDPDDFTFRQITENVEFGQLLALILLGGATLMATLVIPLRLLSVFWGPRTGNYFDQIVLSGITPLRYVIGKATSQNLFLALILFLLLPWLALSLTLGGVDPLTFFAGLFLVWLYCLALALVTLRMSLFLNEFLAAIVVIGAAAFFCGMGLIPMPIQPFVVTPFPALIHPVYSATDVNVNAFGQSFTSVFLTTAGVLSAMIVVSMCGISTGPLFGIIQDNSTFGEVVCKGDAKRKRRFRFRMHIQRPSELSFFYENRSMAFRNWEGLIRWGSTLGGLLFLSCGAFALFSWFMARYVVIQQGTNRYWIDTVHALNLTIHGFSMAFAIVFFSHGRNTTYLRIPFVAGKRVEVSRLDTTAFVLFLLVSTCCSIAVPFLLDVYAAGPAGNSLFEGVDRGSRRNPIDFIQVCLEGTAVISVAAVAVYAFHRMLCLRCWLRSASIVSTGVLYFILICIAPLLLGAFCLEFRELRNVRIVQEWAPTFAMISPFTVFMHLFRELGSRFPDSLSSLPFYIVHLMLISGALLGSRYYGRELRQSYLPDGSEEAGG
jgi:hypothetical protein